MEATFKIDGCTTLRVGNNVSTPQSWSGEPFVGMVLVREPLSIPRAQGDLTPDEPATWTQVAAMKPHEARALASVLLAAATEGKG